MVSLKDKGGCAVVNKFKASKRVPAHMLNSVNAVIEMAELQSFQSKRISRILITPQTATNSQLWMIIGLVLMFVAFVYRRKQKA
jgi:LPXTG-motif cell wall-anchored protein